MSFIHKSTSANVKRMDKSECDGVIKRAVRNSTDLNVRHESTRLFTRSGTFVLQRGVEEGLHGEVEELRRKNRLLQEQVKRTKHQPEKPYEEMSAKEQAQVVIFALHTHCCVSKGRSRHTPKPSAPMLYIETIRYVIKSILIELKC